MIFKANKRQKEDLELKFDNSKIPKPEIIHYDKNTMELYFNPGLIRETTIEVQGEIEVEDNYEEDKIVYADEDQE